MTVQYVKINKYNEITEYPEVDLIFTGPKKSLVDRVSGKSLQFTRNTIGTYVDANGIIQTAVAGEPRYTYDPITGEELGLLIEGSSTNRILYSNLNNWISQPTKTYETGITGVFSESFSFAPTYIGTEAGRIYGTGFGIVNTNDIVSVYVKLKTYISGDPSISFRLGTSGSQAYFSLISKTMGTTGFSWSNPGYVDMGNGWYRFFAKCIETNTSNGGRIYLGDSGGLNNTAIGTEIYLNGFQSEAGPFPTSYIPTTSSTVTRDPDTVTLTNDNLYNNSQFDIINDPFGMSAGSNTLTLLPSNSENSAIKRATIFSSNITQTKINTFAKKTDEFWRWRIFGTSFGLPNFVTDGQVTVDWGDGTVEVLTTAEHTFTNGGGYHDIGFRLDSGTYFGPYVFNDATYSEKVISVGPCPAGVIIDARRLVTGCDNLQAFDATFKARAIGSDMLDTFSNCSSLLSVPFIDTAGVTGFPYAWNNCTSLTSFPLLDTSSGTNFPQSWNNCTSLTSFPLIDTSSATDFFYAWQNCKRLTSFPQLNTSNVTRFLASWQSCSSLTSFPLLDTSSGTTFSSAWKGCTSLTSFPLIDTSSGTNFQGAWQNCTSLISFPLLNTSSSTIFIDAWNNCTSLTSFPLLDTSSGTNFSYAWAYCTSLTSFPLLDTSSGTNFSRAWVNCSSLTSFPLLDISSGTTFLQAWYDCSSLTSFPANFFDSWTATPSNDCFVNAWDRCSSLTATSVENILNSIDTSGRSAPASGVDITIDFNASSGTPNISTAVNNLKGRNWTITLNGVAQ